MFKIFVVEDDPIYTQVMNKVLSDAVDADITIFKTGGECLSHMHENPDLITIDYHLPDTTGLELMRTVKEQKPDLHIFIVSGQDDVEVVVEAYKNGAKGYFVKDQKGMIELANQIKTIHSQVQLQKKVEELQMQVTQGSQYSEIVGNSPAILRVTRMMKKIENSDMMVLITGESGTGKEVIANTLHYHSPRRKRLLVTVNMAAIPEDLVESELFGFDRGAFTGAGSRRIGKFEEANKGTIFLDEIGELPLSIQSKLLRVLQEKEVVRLGSNKTIKLDIRILAATNRDLAAMVKEGKFREDLYYRLQGFLINLPPLRERNNDALLFAKKFLQEAASKNNLGKMSFDRNAMLAILSYDWPGNVRELKSAVERSVLLAENNLVTAEDLLLPVNSNM